MIQQFDSLSEMMKVFHDEQTCIDHLRSIRWASGAFCPYCGSAKVYHFKKTPNVHKCGEAKCRQRFSIKVGTIFEDSKLPLRKWFIAIWMLTSHKKGISSAQLARDLSITQKSAWFMVHRLRHAARTKSFNRPLKGEIEADETFMGGKDKNRHASKKKRGTGGVGSGKTPVFAMLERGGELRAKKVKSVRTYDLQSEIVRNVERGSTVMTDQWPAYNGLDYVWGYHHERVWHSAGEYVRGRFHTNGIEGAFSHFKRQVYGIHHWISVKHMDRYLDEFTWRYNLREMDDGKRMNAFLGRVAGRLTYKALIAE
jgi:transposase-like protein